MNSVDNHAFCHEKHENCQWLPEAIVMARAAIYGVLGHYEAAVDEIIASCNGDLRGAIKALMLVNERLELELQQLHAVDASGSSHLQNAEGPATRLATQPRVAAWTNAVRCIS